jgi:hypothetical protein
MLKRLHELGAADKDFAFETTLASRTFAPWLASLREKRNYRFHLCYLWLPDADFAVSRVAGRIRAGGHAVPAADIRRRFSRGLSNFLTLYAPIADSWEMHDNAFPPAKLIAACERRGPIRFGDRKLWESIHDGMRAKEQEGEYAPGSEPRLMGVPVSEVMDIFTRAGREALARHKALGQSVVAWRGGKIVEIPPEEIEA